MTIMKIRKNKIKSFFVSSKEETYFLFLILVKKNQADVFLIFVAGINVCLKKHLNNT